LDADDRLRPVWLKRAVHLLDTHPEIAFASHWVEAFGDQSFAWKPVRCDLAALLDVNSVNGGALLRRSVFDAVGGFDESMREGCEDWEFWIRVVDRGYVGIIIPEILYDYRQRRDSMSREMHASDAQPRLRATLVEKHRAAFERHLLDLVLLREWAFSDVCRRLDEMGLEVRMMLEPALRERRRELERAEARLAASASERSSPSVQENRRMEADRLQALEHEALQWQAEAQALRDSWSWRFMKPLRRVYEWAGLGGRSDRDR
jgi:hypothetical protein